MWNWENNETKTHGIPYSRYIASWAKKGNGYFGDKFKDWLRSIDLTEDEVWEIYDMATNGKLELEDSIKSYLKNH